MGLKVILLRLGVDAVSSCLGRTDVPQPMKREPGLVILGTVGRKWKWEGRYICESQWEQNTIIHQLFGTTLVFTNVRPFIENPKQLHVTYDYNGNAALCARACVCFAAGHEWLFSGIQPVSVPRPGCPQCFQGNHRNHGDGQWLWPRGEHFQLLLFKLVFGLLLKLCWGIMEDSDACLSVLHVFSQFFLSCGT